MNTTTLRAARGAKGSAMEVFGQFADVIGVGIAPIDGGYGLKINLRQAPPPSVILPSHVDGVPVRVEVARASRSN